MLTLHHKLAKHADVARDGLPRNYKQNDYHNASSSPVAIVAPPPPVAAAAAAAAVLVVVVVVAAAVVLLLLLLLLLLLRPLLLLMLLLLVDDDSDENDLRLFLLNANRHPPTAHSSIPSPHLLQAHLTLEVKHLSASC